jgi:hypothetical protein
LRAVWSTNIVSAEGMDFNADFRARSLAVAMPRIDGLFVRALQYFSTQKSRRTRGLRRPCLA